MNRSALVLLIACVIYILSYFLRVFPTVLAIDIATEMVLSPTQVGIFSSSTLLAYGLMQLPSGILADVLGAKKTIVLLTLLAGLCTALFSFSHNISVMTVSRFLTGLGIAVTVPALAMLARSFPPQMYARAASILLCCGGVGGILAATPLVFLSNSIGWRYAMLLLAGVTLIVAFFAFILIPENAKSETSNLKNLDAEKANVKKKVSIKDILSSIKLILKTREFWPLMIWLTCNAGIYFMLVSFWWGPYFMEAQGLSKEQTGLVLMLSALTLIITQPVLGYLSDVVFKSRKKPTMILAFLGIFASILVCVSTGKITLPIIIVQVVLFQVCIVTATSLIFTMLKESFPLHLAGTATGCMNMFYPIWAAILQVLFGVMLNSRLAAGASTADAYRFAFLLVVANVIVGFCMTLFMKETYVAPSPVASSPSDT